MNEANTNDSAEDRKSRTKTRGHLFIIDVPTFAAVCDLGDADVAAAYLIVAAGTGADNRTSTWSREAINKRTGLNWRKASAALDKLERGGLLSWLGGKGTRKPRLYLPQLENRPPMQKHVAELAREIEAGVQPRTPADKGAATIGLNQGWFAEGADGSLRFLAERPIEKAYLPMSLVGDESGKPTGAPSIVDRIRMSRDAMAFRLMVDLYFLQDLAEQGGVSRYWLEEQFERGETSAAAGSIRVWTFKRGSKSARVQGNALIHHWRAPETPQERADHKLGHYNGAGPFFERVQILEDAGALEWAYYLAEDGKDDSATFYPVGVKRFGQMAWTELESIIGSYATRAACAIGGYPSQADEWERVAPDRFLLPADRSARQVALVGIPRLRHRVKTSNTSRWRQEIVETANHHRDVFRGIIAERAPELLDVADRRLADFNYGSTETSTSVQRDINDTSWSGREAQSLTRLPPHTFGEGPPAITSTVEF